MRGINQIITIMEWNYETVKSFLEKNSYYSHLFDEFEGKFACVYNVNGIGVHVYNVGGRPEIWFGNIIAPESNLKSAIQFVKIAQQVLEEKINN